MNNMIQGHDAWIWDYTREELEKKYPNLINIDLTNNYCKRIKKKLNCDVIIHSRFKDVIYHYKGKRKKV